MIFITILVYYRNIYFSYFDITYKFPLKILTEQQTVFLNIFRVTFILIKKKHFHETQSKVSLYLSHK